MPSNTVDHDRFVSFIIEKNIWENVFFRVCIVGIVVAVVFIVFLTYSCTVVLLRIETQISEVPSSSLS